MLSRRQIERVLEGEDEINKLTVQLPPDNGRESRRRIRNCELNNYSHEEIMKAYLVRRVIDGCSEETLLKEARKIYHILTKSRKKSKLPTREFKKELATLCKSNSYWDIKAEISWRANAIADQHRIHGGYPRPGYGTIRAGEGKGRSNQERYKIILKGGTPRSQHFESRFSL